MSQATANYHKLLSEMDERGFLPDRKCQHCQKPLQGEGETRPAESYLGTFTGLCYTCEKEPAYVVREQADGGKIWSHPPYCPSFRREREEHIAYDDCKECNHGRVIVLRSYALGGSYSSYCKKCLARSSEFNVTETMKHLTLELIDQKQAKELLAKFPDSPSLPTKNQKVVFVWPKYTGAIQGYDYAEMTLWPHKTTLNKKQYCIVKMNSNCVDGGYLQTAIQRLRKSKE